MISVPGAAMSGLTRPSNVGPRLDEGFSMKPPRAGSTMFATVRAFAAEPVSPIVHGSGPLLPAATTGRTPASEAALRASAVALSLLTQPSDDPSERFITLTPYS